MNDKPTLILIPNYIGNFESKIDDKGRVYLPATLRNIIGERNKYNLMSDDIEVIKDRTGIHVLTLKGIPFAAVSPNKITEKDSIDTSTIDDIIYLSKGTLSNSAPDFRSEEPNRLFMYSCIDAQRMLMDENWGDSGFASSDYRTIKIDGYGRIQLNPLEKQIIISESNNLTITCHPLFLCATITKRN